MFGLLIPPRRAHDDVQPSHSRALVPVRHHEIAQGMRRRLRARQWLMVVVLAVVLVYLLAGCAAFSSPHVEVQGPTSLRPPVRDAASMPPPTNGAIFQAVTYRPMFEDRRARLPGDIITVQISEKVSASQSASSTIDKSGKIAANVSALPLIAPNSFKNATATASSANNFEGKGEIANSNLFTGTITATVIEVLPNGNLVIAGEKQIGVNEAADTLRFSGVVDPLTIQTGNVVSSTQVADVRLETRKRGALGEAQQMGWLGRIFLSVLPF
ncbi:MAG TPA: flagellar basal body L-ring protein FlgH [Burkholderiaceae bacterium]|nr:flagellar basal body L-ring protein FlgH [Burkholderiaceae bacterium]